MSSNSLPTNAARPIPTTSPNCAPTLPHRFTAARSYVIDKTFDLFCELGASDEQTDFPVVYCSAINRVAGHEPDAIVHTLHLPPSISLLPAPASSSLTTSPPSISLSTSLLQLVRPTVNRRPHSLSPSDVALASTLKQSYPPRATSPEPPPLPSQPATLCYDAGCDCLPD